MKAISNFTFVSTCVVVVVVVVLFGTASPSAIPMWEYLTADEKIMYLYNMFQTQVHDYCDTNACKQQLKNYAWNKLKDMPEDHLDKMDPFQRGSNDILWDSVMEGHHGTKSSSDVGDKDAMAPAPNKEDEDVYKDDASVILESQTDRPTRTEELGPDSYMIEVNRPRYDERPQSNGIQESSSSSSSSSTTEDDDDDFPIIDAYGHYERAPLTGPMVIKVRVDGTPVDENEDTFGEFPADDDLKQYQLTKTVFQNL